MSERQSEEQQQEGTASVDPFELWRQLYEANERAWTAALEKAMAEPAFAEQSGRLLDMMLSVQKTVRDNVRTYLETINVPTRDDVARLGELILQLEEKIDRLGDRIGALEEAVALGAQRTEG